MTLEEINAAIKEAVELAAADAYERGFRAGKEAVTASFMQMAETISPKSSIAPTDDRVKAESAIEHIAPNLVTLSSTVNRRAPRGLTETVLKQVMSPAIALPMNEVQRRATAQDSRVSEKTVYNELYRKPELFVRDDEGRWRLRGDGEPSPSGFDWPKSPTQEREEGEAPTAH